MGKNHFGNRVKYFRIQKGMTQSDLGERLGVSQVTIANYERGKRFPKERYLKGLGEILSISMDRLLNPNEDKAFPQRMEYEIETFLEILLYEDLEISWTYLTNWKTTLFWDSEKIFLEIFIPLLDLLGDRWHKKKVLISQEHMVSEKIKVLITRLTHEELNFKDISLNKSKRWMGLCAPSEQHEMVLFMLSNIMRLRGWDVYYLGLSVPLSDLRQLLEKINPQILTFSITLQEHRPGLETYLKGLKPWGKRKVIIGGKGINAYACHSISPEIIYAQKLEDTLIKSLISGIKGERNE